MRSDVPAADRPGADATLVILIEIDPAVSGGYVHGRFDIMIRGRAVSTAAIEEIRLQVDDWVTSTASFGQPERAASAVMADGTPARQRGFRFNLPRPGDGQAERCAFQIVARTEDGFEYAEDFEIDVDPAAGDPVSIVSGPARANAGAVAPVCGDVYRTRGDRCGWHPVRGGMGGRAGADAGGADLRG